ncbi:MAG: hypothetical protein IJY04_03535, partial [Clostridia bacterium]|nr:hypothetical protein [Clostridia bacterium]
TPGWSALLAIAFGIGGVWLGYGIASLWGLLTGCERVKSDYSYERVDKYFSMGTLIPSLIVLLGISIGVSAVARELTAYVTSSGQVIYDNASMLPAIFGACFLACAVIGCILWFVPYNKVISVSNIIPLGVGFFIIAIAGGALMGAPSWFLSAAFIIFLFCSMVVINQGYLIKIINECGTGSANNEIRKYNISAVIVVFIALSVAGFFATALLVGLVVSGRILMLALFKNAFRGDSGSSGDSVGSSPGFNVSEKIFGDVMDLEGEGNAMFYYIIFILMIVAFFVALFLYRRKQGKRLPKPTELISRLYSLILSIVAWFSGLLTGKRNEELDISLDDYTDEELLMDKSADKKLPSADTKRGLRRLVRMLSECKDDAERLSLCYRASRARYIKKHRLLREGDSPFVLAEKLRHLVAEQEYERFHRMTDDYVGLAYAGILPDSRSRADVSAEIDYLTREASDHPTVNTAASGGAADQ